MDRKTRALFTQFAAFDEVAVIGKGRGTIYRGQNNAAEHNDQRHRRINKGHYGQCHCRAVRPFCLSRDICSGTDASGPDARYALAFKARTSGEQLETVLRRNFRTLSKFAQSLPIEFTR